MSLTENTPPARLDGDQELKRAHLQVFWILIATFTISFAYEAIYRYIVKAGVSSFDAWSFSEIVFYVVGFGMTLLVLLLRASWMWWVLLLFLLALIAIAIFYYDPVMLLARHPGPIDWIEDTVYTGLLFVVAFLCLYHLRSRPLLARGAEEKRMKSKGTLNYEEE
jgi:hypothetical protein